MVNLGAADPFNPSVFRDMRNQGDGHVLPGAGDQPYTNIFGGAIGNADLMNAMNVARVQPLQMSRMAPTAEQFRTDGQKRAASLSGLPGSGSTLTFPLGGDGMTVSNGVLPATILPPSRSMGSEWPARSFVQQESKVSETTVQAQQRQQQVSRKLHGRPLAIIVVFD